ALVHGSERETRYDRGRKLFRGGFVSQRAKLVRPFAKLVFLLLAGGALAALPVSNAQAYPWMIRHEYTGCMPCHADPSGGGILTAYGRAQGEILLSMRYGKSAEEDPGPGGEFLWGLVKLPPEFLLEPTFRSAYLNSRLLPSNGAPVDSRYIQ